MTTLNKKTIFSIILTLALLAVYAFHLTKTRQPEVFKTQKEYKIIQLPIRVHVVKDINVGEIKMKNFLTEKKIPPFSAEILLNQNLSLVRVLREGRDPSPTGGETVRPLNPVL